MDAGFLDVLHDAADDDVFTIRERVNVHFDGIFQKLVDQDRTVVRVLDCLLHVLRDGIFVEGDDHGASAENVGRANEHGKADLSRGLDGFFRRGRHRSGRLRNTEFLEQLSKTLAVFGKIDGFGRRAYNAHSGGFEGERQVERRLSAELDDYADRRSGGSFVLADGEHVFERERLEVVG